MKHSVITTALTLLMATVSPFPRAIANTNLSTTETDRAPELQQPDSATRENFPNLGTNLPGQRIQPSQSRSSDGKPTPDTYELTKSYPAYCEFYLFNVEPGSWQFKQDIQRCLYGQ
ncbi:MAG: hypothetical protein KME27_06500 [Lyngbya sp. HA4199-MV5]|jgi:hypothetical protein|nr:hypothetical protein [Lyngbya sp. HA4199-MV5]